jgi:pyridinium-3,5-biscarboxylic acid mononucleotide sulfurtransferase
VNSQEVDPDLAPREAHLREILQCHAPLLIAYSGGVDSTLLLAIAHETLGERATGIIADSPSLPRASLAEAIRVAGEMGASVEVVATSELEDPRYTANPMNRCYFCKSELFTRMDQVARDRGFAAIAYGENADDPAHLRPGSKAAAEFSVIAPLKEAGLTKAHVRQLSRTLGLPTAEAPAQPCLSSRIPHGTPVTRKALHFVERGEAIVRQFGFDVFRVRYLPPEESMTSKPGARLQIAIDEMQRLPTIQSRLITALTEGEDGFGRIEIDPEGYCEGKRGQESDPRSSKI